MVVRLADVSQVTTILNLLSLRVFGLEQERIAKQHLQSDLLEGVLYDRQLIHDVQIPLDGVIVSKRDGFEQFEDDPLCKVDVLVTQVSQGFSVLYVVSVFGIKHRLVDEIGVSNHGKSLFSERISLVTLKVTFELLYGHVSWQSLLKVHLWSVGHPDKVADGSVERLEGRRLEGAHGESLLCDSSHPRRGIA